MPFASFLGQDEVTFQRSSQDATASRSCDSVYVQKSMPSHRIVQTIATHQLRCQCIPNSFEKKPCRSYCDQKRRSQMTAEEQENSGMPPKRPKLAVGGVGSKEKTARGSHSPLSSFENIIETDQSAPIGNSAPPTSYIFNVIEERARTAEEGGEKSADRDVNDRLFQLLTDVLTLGRNQHYITHKSARVTAEVEKAIERIQQHTVRFHTDLADKMKVMSAHNQSRPIRFLNPNDDLSVRSIVFWEGYEIVSADLKVEWTGRHLTAFADFFLEAGFATKLAHVEGLTASRPAQHPFANETELNTKIEAWNMSAQDRYVIQVLVDNKQNGPLGATGCQCIAKYMPATAHHDRASECRSRRLAQDFYLHLKHKMLNRPLSDVRSLRMLAGAYVCH
ncbi:unnamed protein product [Caenorhabditis nigoni]